MIADVLKTESPAVRVVEVSGVSANGWSDAVWQAIAPVLGHGRRLVELGVLRHWTASRRGSPNYRVRVRLAFAPARSVSRTEPSLPMSMSPVETTFPHQGDVSCVARPVC